MVHSGGLLIANGRVLSLEGISLTEVQLSTRLCCLVWRFLVRAPITTAVYGCARWTCTGAFGGTDCTRKWAEAKEQTQADPLVADKLEVK